MKVIENKDAYSGPIILFIYDYFFFNGQNVNRLQIIIYYMFFY